MKSPFAGPALVTGAGGFIGSWLVKALLERQIPVIAFILPDDAALALAEDGALTRCTVVRGDLSEPKDVDRAFASNPRTVFHLGAQTLVGEAREHPWRTFESNIRGTYNLLESCRRATSVERIVVASSDKAYGDSSELPYTEKTPLVGRHPYDVSKSCTDLITQTYFHTYRMPVAIARCGNVYGGGDHNWSRIVPGTIQSLLKRERPIIRSDGQFKRDYIYVKDVVNAYLTLAEHLGDKTVHGEGFNFGWDKPMTVLAVVDALRTLMNCGEITPDIRNEAKAEIRDQWLTCGKARDVLGWKPTIPFETALQETLGWYTRHLS